MALNNISNGTIHYSNLTYRLLSKEKGNIIFSPFTTHVILSLLYQGSAGLTTKALSQALCVSHIHTTTRGYNILMKALKSVQDVKLYIANKIYAPAHYQLKEEFQIIAKNSFSAEAENINFNENIATADIINTWIETNTNENFKNIINSNDINKLTHLVLISGAYFKSDWLYAFKTADTQQEIFHLSETKSTHCDMMHITRSFKYCQDIELDSAQVISIPYKNENFNLMIFLPRSKGGLKSLENKLFHKNLAKINQKLQDTEIILSLPKFKIESTKDLNALLTDMRLNIIFSHNAEFPNMLKILQKLDVSKVVHRSFLEVKEDGVEAEYETPTEEAAESICCPIKLTVDHPFFFTLSFKQEGEIFPLFVGRINNPNN